MSPDFSPLRSGDLHAQIIVKFFKRFVLGALLSPGNETESCPATPLIERSLHIEDVVLSSAVKVL